MMETTINTDLQSNMHSVIQRIATGPELSKDVSREECRLAMKSVLDGVVDPVQAAIFLIALRMKRETMDENAGVLDAIREAVLEVTADVDEVVDIVDPYNGYNRCLPPSPFLPALLAEAGVNAVSHGLETVGPKYGITHKKVLRHAGVDVDISPKIATARLSEPSLGWAYIDQSQYSPKLFALKQLRNLMVKRQVITTVEVLAKPIQGRKKNHLVTGFVHKPYPPKYADLARKVGFDSSLFIRGVEGGVNPTLRAATKHYHYKAGGELVELLSDPNSLGIEQNIRITQIPADSGACNEKGVATDVDLAARLSAETGVAALKGQRGTSYDSLAYDAALILLHLGRVDHLEKGFQQIKSILDSGKAAARVR